MAYDTERIKAMALLATLVPQTVTDKIMSVMPEEIRGLL